MVTDYSADVVIVGSGIAGCQLGEKLAKAGVDVLILEAGPRVNKAHIVENFRNSPVKLDMQVPYPPAPYAPHPNYKPDNEYFVQKGPHEYPAGYLRLVGGTTWHWAGQAWRLTPQDFTLQSEFGVGRDWPITYDELEPYYYEAEVEMGVGGPEKGWFAPRSKPYPHPPIAMSSYDIALGKMLAEKGYGHIVEPAARNAVPFDGRPACAGNNNCMPVCPIGAMYTGDFAVMKAEQAGATIQENSVVYNIEADDRGTITAVHYKDPNGTSHRVTGKCFVLAANAIEISKLLLISTSDKFPGGIANSSDQVGRNLMDHPGTGVKFLAKDPVWPGRGPQVISCIPDFCNGDFRGDHSAFKLVIENITPTVTVTEMLIDQGVYGAELDERIRYMASRYVSIVSMFDILPDPENRIVPSKEKKDILGIPHPEVHYRIDEYVQRASKFAAPHYQQFSDMLEGEVIQIQDNFANNNHIMGTVIMGNDPTNSVVDRELRAHDHPNLYMATSGVMPSAGTVNCTLTIAALVRRLADTMLDEMKNG